MRPRTVPTADFVTRFLALAMCAIAMSIVFPTVSHAQSPEKVKQVMAVLKDKTAWLGAPGVKGADAVAGKDIPALYVGATKMNNNFTVIVVPASWFV